MWDVLGRNTQPSIFDTNLNPIVAEVGPHGNRGAGRIFVRVRKQVVQNLRDPSRVSLQNRKLFRQIDLHIHIWIDRLGAGYRISKRVRWV